MNTEPQWRNALRGLIVHKLKELGPLDNHALANACQVNQDAIAPRLSELEALGQVRDTGRRHSSVSGRGRKLKVWETL